MWLSRLTRPDISNAVRAVARYRTAPKAINWKVSFHTLEYIKEAKECGITHQGGTLASISLGALADADYAFKPTDRRSVSGEAIASIGFQEFENASPV